MTYLTLNGIRADYGSTTILDNIDLEVERGEMHILLGPSGCGKTTLLRAIAGLVQPQSGVMTLSGRRIDTLKPQARGIGMVFQHYALFPTMTVRQNLAFGLEQQKRSKRHIDDKVASALETVSLTDKADRRPHQLSGGQKQRVALARALVLEPELLLLDEPLSALDAQIRKKLRDELRRIQRDIGLTSILVTHDQDEALTLGDRISVMNAGQIAQTGSGADIYYRPANLFVARFIGDANIIDSADFRRMTGQQCCQTAIIQPHSLKVENAGVNSGENALCWQAKVVDTSVAGAVVRYQLLAANVLLKAENHTANGAQYFQPGEEVTLSIKQHDIHLL